ncbi:MAG: hypothetical protein KAG84_04995 [Bacteroidales bacterium]|nr:hypothetical protein [Bacteroidales bacterium]
MEDDNFRLACGLYEQVELISMRKTLVKVVYNNVNGSIQEIEGLITDVYVKNKVEYIQIDNKKDIQTSQISNIISNKK